MKKFNKEWNDNDFLAINREGIIIAYNRFSRVAEDLAHRYGEPRPLIIEASRVEIKNGLVIRIK